MKRSLLAAALALALPAAAAAQARPLSLEQAIATAGENNPAYRKALAEVTGAEAERRRAAGAFLPTLDLRVSTNGDYTRSFTGRDEFGQPVTRDDPIESRSSYMSQGVSINGITLFDGGARLREYRASQASTDATKLRAGGEALRMRGEVTRRYWAAVRASRVIALEEGLLASARERVEVTERLMRVAVRTPVDVLGARVQVAEQEGALEKARGDLRRALLDLRQEMGVIDDAPLALTDEPPALFDPAALDPAALAARAVEGHPRLARAHASERAAQQKVGAARAGRWPTVSASASVGRGQYFSGYDGLYELNPLNQSLGFGIVVSYPLFNQFRTSTQVAQARAGLTAAQEDVRAERLAVERDVRAAAIDLQVAHAAAAHAVRTLELNRERVALAQEQYRAGALGFADLQDAAEGAAKAEREALRTRFEFAAAHATLEEKVGAPVRP
ncbi:MAG TPA: TolC family protein [Longimicrobium sp.]|nr:TolC family protein [Longimicrobium sp.]